MFCKRAILVNWGNIPNRELDFGPINLFSGGNGSGKTTAADALQSLMTAAHENLFNFNPGQDETTQRGRGGKQVRTLASYVLGCDDGSYARPHTTDGYVAAVFHPTQGETCEQFTAVLCVRASLDTAGNQRQARMEELQFLILPNIALSLSHFVRQDKHDKYVTPLTDLPKLLMKEYGRNAVEIYDKKGPYLRRLYGIFRGEKAAVGDREAKHAARTFSNFMAYKPVKSITEFVAREILEPKDLSEDIRQVSELMKTIHGMEEDTRRVNDAITNLESARTQAQLYIENWIARSVTEYTEQSRLVLGKQADYVKGKQQQGELKQGIEDTQALIHQVDQQRERLHEEHVSLLAQRQGIAALKDKDQLERDIEQFNNELGTLVGPLLTQDQKFIRNANAATELLKLSQKSHIGLDASILNGNALAKVLNPVIQAGNNTGIDAQSLQTKDWIDNSALTQRLNRITELETLHNVAYRFLHTRDNNIAEQIYLALHRKTELKEKAKNQANTKQHEVQKLQHQRVSYPAHVEAAISAINEQCPEAQPSVLCDFIEVTDEKWQMAIEGYIGGARFGIVVEPDYEAEAIQIVRNIGGRRNNARVVQGAKAQRDAHKLTTPKNSIIDVMRFDHKIVEYYLRASYGNVVRVSDAEKLRNTARGITSSGMGSGNYSLFRCDIDEADLVFGSGARERALRAKEAQLRSLHEQANNLAQECQELNSLRTLISDIQEIKCADIIQSMLKLYSQLQQAESQLGNLDLKDYEALEAQLDELKQSIKQLDIDAKKGSQTLGSLETQLHSNQRYIDRIANEQEQLQAAQEVAEAKVTSIGQSYAEFNAEQALINAEAEAKSAGTRSLEKDITEYCTAYERNERLLYEHILEHNRHSQQFNSINYATGNSKEHEREFFNLITKTQTEIARIYNSLKNNVLVGKHEKLLALKESFNTTFVTNLCHSIYQSINDGKRTLDELNKELEHHRFGADRERFYFAYEWLPEFREYWRFFEEIIKSPSLGDGSTLFEADLSEKSTTIRDKLLSMLLDKDEQTALNELKRISDYRNFRRYEIFKEPENKEPIPLSTYGTGSGGQLETPAYIIRSAAITSAFRFNEGKSHCRMVLVDEAFSKMDETRSREVIHYLTESLGLQLLFIMPSSKSGPFMDLISNQVVFSKCPTNDKVGELNTRVLVDRKTCNTDKIKALWANHRHTIRQQASLDFMEDIS